MPPLELEIENTGEAVVDLITFVQDEALEQKYRLTYTLPENHPLLVNSMQLHYSGRDSDTSLGLTFEPLLGEDTGFQGRSVSWVILIKTRGCEMMWN